MLDENTENPTTGDAGETAAASEKPVVRKTTRKAPAKRATKKTAAAEAPAADAPAADAPEAPGTTAKPARATTRRTTKKAASAPSAEVPPEGAGTPEATGDAGPAESAPVKKTTRKRSASTRARKATDAGTEAAVQDGGSAADPQAVTSGDAPAVGAVLFQPPPKVTTRTRKKAAAAPAVQPTEDAVAGPEGDPLGDAAAADEPAGPAGKSSARGSGRTAKKATTKDATKDAATADDEAAPKRATAKKSAAKRSTAKKTAAAAPAEETDEDLLQLADSEAAAAPSAEGDQAEGSTGETAADETAEDATGEAEGDESQPTRRRRRRGGRRRRKGSDSQGGDTDSDDAGDESGDDSDDNGPGDDAESGSETSSRRRRRRRRAGDEGSDGDDDPNTVTRVRKARSAEDQITAVTGSTRLEAKKQRRREGREAGRRRAPIVSEAEFLARRESVDRTMVIRQRGDLTQIAVLEDKVLVEHYVARESQTSLIGNVYLGRVQNVLPSMEAAFIDIGKGRNAVLYAGEVNWSALGHKEGQPRKIESVLQSGQTVLVQVTKDPVGHKGARLTSQISLAGRFLVYVPDGTTSGISRKLPDTERNRLKTLLKEIVPDSAGVIVRTAAEGASEEELTRDVERLKARWEDIEKKAAGKGGGAQLLYGEPDLTLKVVRDLFTEDFTRLVIEGDDAWDTVHGYVEHVAPDLVERVERFERGENGKDVFASFRIDEQISKGLDRKVWLPSGGSLIIDRTEAMTVVDVNTGKFTGSGGNLEETVTKNNLEAAEEIVRQLRLRDIGGIIVVDFIDMVLESNRDLVVRRLVECLGRDRTRHQVAEVTSLGLVQMTRKRIGTGLLEAFSENCDHCHGRGVVIKDSPVDAPRADEDEGRRGGRRNRGRKGGNDGANGSNGNGSNGNGSGAAPSPKDVAAMARHEKAAEDVEVAGPAASTAPDAPVDEAVAELAQPPAEESQQAETPEVETPEADKPEVETPEAGKPEAETPEVEASAKPAVVTRTRRRAASRPAGPPAGVAGTAPTSGAVEPGTADLEPGPAGAGEVSAEGQALHVPVKKRGARKR